MNHLTVSLGQGWQRVREGELETLAFEGWGKGLAVPRAAPHEPLALTPGKHTIRVAYFLYERRVDGLVREEFRVETNAVEFEIVK